MSDTIDFNGQVAWVTGAGGGLGREYALGLAARGARVVVNDLGGSLDGQGGSASAADRVVQDIRAAGGEAIASAISVTDEAGVATLTADILDRWGRLDILIANAGILRDSSFAKMSLADFRAVMDVHLMGTVIPIKAVWETMRAQNYGRIVVTTSSTGLYGNFGQANYGAAKLALVGLMNTLKIEGQKNDIRVNAVSPVAGTRMTENLAPPEVLARLDPKYVAPAVLYLASRDAPTGAIVAAGAGVLARPQIWETEGRFIGTEGMSVEQVRDQWDAIGDPSRQQAYFSNQAQGEKLFRLAAQG